MADVFGAAGRRAIEERLPSLREEIGAGFCIVNGENIADGAGITPKLADRLLAAGADTSSRSATTRGREAGDRDYLGGRSASCGPSNGVSSGSPGRPLTVAPAQRTGRRSPCST